MAFNKLPIELNKLIASYLDSDRDIVNFSTVCRNTGFAIDGDNFSFWRARFQQYYALKPPTRQGYTLADNTRCKTEYQKRRLWLRRSTNFDFHDCTRDRSRGSKALEILRDLVRESFSGSEPRYDEYDRPICINFTAIRSFLRSSLYFPNIMGFGADSQVPQQLAAMQLMYSHFMFDAEWKGREILSFDVSQKAVYESAKTAPIFRGYNKTDINMEWVLHVLNFFRYHMMNEQMGSLAHAYDELSDLQKPSPWKAKLKEGVYPLGKYWRGTYAYLDEPEVFQIRHNPAGTCVLMDKNIDNDQPFQTLRLEFVEGEKVPWPQLFEHHLESKQLPVHARTRAQHRSKSPTGDPVSFRIQGEGDDDPDHFYASGWLNPLPAQPENCEIPGWYRITFMKHFIDHVDGEDQMNDELWAYEGVVMPGGQIILGRWWWVNNDVPRENAYSGPFIFWAVEPEIPEIDDMSDSDC